MTFRRREMVEKLKLNGIADSRVLAAFLKVERHRFFDRESQEYAYEDRAYPIGYGQTISQPYTVACMTSLLVERSPAGKVLEIGTGSGYQAAILDALGYRVYTVERISALYEKAEMLFSILELSITCRSGDGTLGWPEEAPFNGIMVTAGAPHCPDSLLGQLALDGSLVVPIGEHGLQKMTVFQRKKDRFEKEVFNDFAFVPLIGREGWN
jgi:protein-L-isoaspartate(D-aspartate) O-methyltransferase